MSISAATTSTSALIPPRYPYLRYKYDVRCLGWKSLEVTKRGKLMRHVSTLEEKERKKGERENKNTVREYLNFNVH